MEVREKTNFDISTLEVEGQSVLVAKIIEILDVKIGPLADSNKEALIIYLHDGVNWGMSFAIAEAYPYTAELMDIFLTATPMKYFNNLQVHDVQDTEFMVICNRWGLDSQELIDIIKNFAPTYGLN